MLDFEVESIGPFRMQSWSSRDQVWHSHDLQPGKEVWKPRPTLEDAAVKCLTWTGLIGIPAMQVIDMSTGEVVWRYSDEYPDAGESIPLPNEEAVRERVRADLRADRDQPAQSPVDAP
jgi:hypothetical protein